MPVLITVETEECFPQIEIGPIERAAQLLLDICNCRGKELSILLTCDSVIAELNSRYRKKQGPTNVLAFPMLDETDKVAPDLLGDIVISVETAAQEAKKENSSMGQRIVFLLIHGLLHLLGHDHERSDAEADRMEAEEQRVLGLLNQSFKEVL